MKRKNNLISKNKIKKRKKERKENENLSDKEKEKELKISEVSHSSRILNAKKIIIVPEGRNRNINLNIKDDLQKLIEGKKVSEGCKIFLDNGPNLDLSFNYPFFRELNLFKVLETVPKGELKITKETVIIFKNRPLDEFDIPDKNIINVTNYPNLNNLTEVKDITQIIKLAKAGFLINKFENKKEIIFLVDIYYFKKMKV